MTNERACQVPTDLMRRATGGAANGLTLALLWSNPDISAVGHTPNAIATLSKYTGMAESEIGSALAVLERGNQIIFDEATGEALVPEWFDLNYLQEQSPAARPDEVLAAWNGIKSAKLRASLVDSIHRLDVITDAGLIQK